MERRTLYITLALISLSLKVCVLATRSSPSYSYSYPSSYSSPSYTAPSYSSSYGKLDRELERLREDSVQRSCATSPDLHVELVVTEPSLAALDRETQRANLPSGTWLPSKLSAGGLAVSLQERNGGASRVCLDANEALLKKALERAKPSSGAISLGSGAWVIETTDDTAGAALLSRSVREQLNVKGALIAFAPTDNVVTFADGANPAAVALAAKEAAKRTDTSGDQGCIAAEPLALSSGAWATWLPGAKHAAAKDVERFRTAARECQANLAQIMVTNLSMLDVDPTERTFSADKGATVTVLLDESDVPQLVARANTVVVDSLDGTRYSMDWATFEARAAGHLKPLVVKGTTVSQASLFTGGMSVKDFAGMKGVVVAKASP